MEDKILPRVREERVAIIEAGKVELWRIYYQNKVKLEVRRIGDKANTNPHE